MEKGRRDEILLWSAVALITAIFCWYVPAFFHSLEFDTSTRYAVMAEEFAAGNFHEAFHPRFGVLIQVVAGGLVWLTGIDGFSACQVFAVLGWGLSAIPLWYIFREVFGRESAWWSVALLFCMPMYFKLAGDGMRDDMRILSIALCVLGWLRSATVSGAVWTSVGLFLGVTLRADAVITTSVYAAVYSVFVVLRRKPWFAVLPLLALVAGILLDSMMVFHYTGIFVPISHAVPFFNGF